MSDELIWENQEAIARWFRSYRSWYCKKNQPGNYIRLTCRKDPDNPGNTYFWRCGIQVFGKVGRSKEVKYIDGIHMTADAYRNFPMCPGWGPLITAQGGNYEYRIYKNPNANELGAEN